MTDFNNWLNTYLLKPAILLSEKNAGIIAALVEKNERYVLLDPLVY
jgi:hypothetical protein